MSQSKKKCSKCKEKKPATPEYFYRKGNGLGSWCKSCYQKRDKKYENRPDRKIRRKELRNKPEAKRKAIEYRKKYYQQPKIKLVQKGHHLKAKYGITLDEHRLIYVLQNGKCAICKQLIAYDKMDTDHNHSTGKVRGLLCQRCNHLLAGVDDKIFLKQALKYLNNV